MNSGSRSSLRTGKYLAKKRYTLLDVEVFHSRAFFTLIRSKIEHVVKFDLVSSTVPGDICKLGRRSNLNILLADTTV